jgi:hypothetical protein
VPLANVFKTMNVGGHPLVTNRMCDAGDAFRLVIQFSSTSYRVVRNDG